MAEASLNVFLEKLDGLRTELVDLAFTLECRGRPEAADVAMTTAARVGELGAELRRATQTADFGFKRGGTDFWHA
jgi:hypothetical protein